MRGYLRAVFIEDRADGPVPRLLPLLVAAMALVPWGVRWPALAPLGVAGIGALLTVAAARGNRFLLGAALFGFGVRALLAAVSHRVIALDLAILHPLRSPETAGYRFWTWAPDATWYHSVATAVAIAWRQGTEFPEGLVPEYSILAAFIYRFLGSNPLNVVLWNALFGALAVVAGYRIAARLAGPAAARPAAILIALWPSAVLWSTQLLKDTVSLWLILLVLYLTMCAMDPPDVTRSGWRAIARWAGLCVALFTVALILHRFRHYVLQVLIPVSAVFIIYAFVHRTRRMPWRIAATCAVVAVLVLAVSASRRVDLDRLFAPRYPEIGHVNLAVMHQSRGDLDRARKHYERALGLATDYPPALKGLGTIALARGERSRAIGYFERSLAAGSGDEQVRATLAALRRPEAAVASLQQKRVKPLQAARPLRPGREIPGAVAARSPAPIDVRRQPSDAAIRPAPAGTVTRGRPADGLQSDAKRVLALIPTPVPMPARPFEITGQRSDDVTGARAWQYGDVLGGLSRMRRGFTSAGGHSLIDGDVEFHGYWDVLGYLPKAVANVFLVPYPWQWFDIGGSTGLFRALSVVETVLLYALIVPLTVGLWAGIRRGPPDALYLALFVLAQAVLLGLIVNNMGTLFRLRLQLLLPLFVAMGLGWAWLLDRRRLVAAIVSGAGSHAARRPSE
jgi:hypothetical protein